MFIEIYESTIKLRQERYVIKKVDQLDELFDRAIVAKELDNVEI